MNFSIIITEKEEMENRFIATEKGKIELRLRKHIFYYATELLLSTPLLVGYCLLTQRVIDYER